MGLRLQQSADLPEGPGPVHSEAASLGSMISAAATAPSGSAQFIYKLNCSDSGCESLPDSTQPRYCLAPSPSLASPRQLFDTAAAHTATSWRGLKKVAKAHPLVAIVPLLVFAVAMLVGQVGVWAGCEQVQRQRLQLTAHVALTAANETSMMLHLWMASATAAASVISQQPHVPSLVSRNDWMASVLLAMSGMTGNDPVDSTFLSLFLYPWGTLTAAYPPTPDNLAGLNIDTFYYPDFQNKSINFAATQAGQYDVLGPILGGPFQVKNPDGSDARIFWQMMNVFLPTSNLNETWGMDEAFTFPWAQGTGLGNVSQPPWQGPCGAGCEPRKQADGSYLLFWGFLVVQVPGYSIFDRLDAMSNDAMYDSSFNYVLFRRDTPSDSDLEVLQHMETLGRGELIISETPGAAQRATDGQHVCQDVPNPMDLQWTLCIAPVGGYYPSWRAPAIVAVVLAALVLASLMFVLMVSLAKHKTLVNAMLPPKAVQYLSLHRTYAEQFQMLTILFSDIVSYTELSSQLEPPELVQMLDCLYSGFDDLVDKHRLYKVETVGDAFMCVGGAPDPCEPCDAARRVAQMALDMLKLAESFEVGGGRKIQIRIGMHTGNATAAVMGRKMPHWTLIGDAVNVSSRMESNSKPMHVHVSATTAQLLSRFPELELKPRGSIDVKGKGPMCTFWLAAAPPPAPAAAKAVAAEAASAASFSHQPWSGGGTRASPAGPRRSSRLSDM